MHQIEGIENRFLIEAAGVQVRKVSYAVLIDANRLAVHRERCRLDLERGRYNARIPVCPIEASTGEQPHSVAVLADLHAVAVVFDFVNPAFARWNLVGVDAKAGLDELGRQQTRRFGFYAPQHDGLDIGLGPEKARPKVAGDPMELSTLSRLMFPSQRANR